jgi:hypothetical protein
MNAFLEQTILPDIFAQYLNHKHFVSYIFLESSSAHMFSAYLLRQNCIPDTESQPFKVEC